jgi:hypothetical protein
MKPPMPIEGFVPALSTWTITKDCEDFLHYDISISNITMIYNSLSLSTHARAGLIIIIILNNKRKKELGVGPDLARHELCMN